VFKLDFDEKDLFSLRIFCYAAKAGGFSAAEKYLPLSKASISRHVRRLEKRLDVRLCERAPAGFHLTPEGELALTLASDVFHALQLFRTEIDASRGVLSGLIRIGVGQHTVSHKQSKLSEALAILNQKAPNIQPEIFVASFTELDRALRERNVDIAIRGKYKKNKEFNYLPLYYEQHQFFISSKAVCTKDASQLPLIYRKHPYVEQALATGLYQKGPHANDLDAVSALIATGCYQGILPTFYAELLKDKFQLSPVRGATTFLHTTCAVTPAAISLDHRVRFFLKIMEELHPITEQERFSNI